MNLWGIDLGGTKMEGAILESKESPIVLHRMRIPTEAQLGYEHIVDQVVKAHGGNIQVTDNQPKGTVFTLEI